jgi:hypothetical protein
MVDLATVHAQISTEIKRGTSHDTKIAAYLRRAVRFLEQNNNFEHMKYLRTFTINHLATYPRFFEFPNDRIKAIRSVRFIESDGSIVRLIPSFAEDHGSVKAAAPTHYWREGIWRFVLNNEPQETYSNSELRTWEYTDWPTATTDTHWWTDNQESLIVAQTIMEMENILRDAKMHALFKEKRDEQLKVALDAQFDREEDSNFVMGYNIDYANLYSASTASNV